MEFYSFSLLTKCSAPLADALAELVDVTARVISFNPNLLAVREWIIYTRGTAIQTALIWEINNNKDLFKLFFNEYSLPFYSNFNNQRKAGIAAADWYKQCCADGKIISTISHPCGSIYWCPLFHQDVSNAHMALLGNKVKWSQATLRKDKAYIHAVFNLQHLEVQSDLHNKVCLKPINSEYWFITMAS